MQIKSAKYLISSPSYEKCPKPDKPEYAFIGRSNVGKSSLINMLVNQKNLAKTSATPGKTQLINHFLINDSWYLVDLPGYGYAKRSQRDRNRWEQMIENYLRKRENLMNVFVLIDARHSPQQNDLAFVNKLGEWQIPFVLVFTKVDKEKPTVVLRNEKLFLEKMKESWQFLPQSFITSAEKKQGKEELLMFIQNCNEGK
ncbi:MAG: ribosome biogenesis GTP-binding protein YihA/YsxC [Chitinophagaceae bacterium]|nr:ribosome biogenesis GTP-binding protein YihA/YsxC [Chitinophagaceae bacterium]MCW5906117.1 ribosome biogenesis GTP-binding protein YihA/YsxC [Chitinophagaceae bacterium]